jgi:hypothetical protein
LRSWQWSDYLSSSEEQQLEDLMELLADFSLQLNIPDRWRWVSGSVGIFSIKFSYNLLLQYRNVDAFDSNVLAAIEKL